MAPERSLRRVFERCRNIRYCTADLESPLASVHTDLTLLSFADDRFDVVLCNHVLEHIPDDRRAMRELVRVLKPGGWAILQVPIAATRSYTEEAPEITNPGERLRLFGQTNHVRLYAAKDYAQRLKAAGFTVELESLPKRMGERYSRYFGLLADEEIFVAKKPPSQSRPRSENTVWREPVLEPGLAESEHSGRAGF